MRTSRIGLAAVACLAAACASSGATQHASGTTFTASAPTTATANVQPGQVFTADDLSRSAASNVYDALQQLQPEVLSGHGRGAPDVYVDRVLQSSGLDRLRNLSLTSVEDVTYLRADQAQSQGLTDSKSAGGAILVRLR